MIPYIFGLAVVVIVWLLVAVPYILKGLDTTGDLVLARRARLTLLSVFLIPVYPIAVIAAVPVGIILIFRQLGRNAKKKENG
jgi:hypothetical protein